MYTIGDSLLLPIFCFVKLFRLTRGYPIAEALSELIDFYLFHFKLLNRNIQILFTPIHSHSSSLDKLLLINPDLYPPASGQSLCLSKTIIKWQSLLLFRVRLVFIYHKYLSRTSNRILLQTVVHIHDRYKQLTWRSSRTKVCTYRTKICFILNYIEKSFVLPLLSRIFNDSVSLLEVTASYKSARGRQIKGFQDIM